jgi:hypothetical protein
VNAIAGKAGSRRHQVPVTQPYDSQPKRSLFATEVRKRQWLTLSIRSVDIPDAGSTGIVWNVDVSTSVSGSRSTLALTTVSTRTLTIDRFSPLSPTSFPVLTDSATKTAADFITSTVGYSRDLQLCTSPTQPCSSSSFESWSNATWSNAIWNSYGTRAGLSTAPSASGGASAGSAGGATGDTTGNGSYHKPAAPSMITSSRGERLHINNVFRLGLMTALLYLMLGIAWKAMAC